MTTGTQPPGQAGDDDVAPRLGEHVRGRERGQSMVEYSVLVALTTGVMVGAFTFMAGAADGLITEALDTISGMLP